MTPDQSRLLDALEAFVINYPRAGRTRRQFWDEYGGLEDPLVAAAEAADDDEMRNRLGEIMDDAHEGYGCPPEQEDEVMEV